jgi:aspartate racemase
MKTLGIIGGLGPESTVDYYKLIVASYRARSNGSYPSVLINSIDLNKAIALVTAGELPALAEYIAREVERLRAAGCDFALISANTPHIAFAEIKRRSLLPLLSIVESTLEATKNLGFKRVGLFGTRFTMESDFYQSAFSGSGLEVIVPSPEERDLIHEKYMKELLQGVFLPETRAQLLRIIDRMRIEERIQALILAGTELPLILRDTGSAGIPFLDTTQIHIEAAVSMLVRDIA